MNMQISFSGILGATSFLDDHDDEYMNSMITMMILEMMMIMVKGKRRMMMTTKRRVITIDDNEKCLKWGWRHKRCKKHSKVAQLAENHKTCVNSEQF